MRIPYQRKSSESVRTTNKFKGLDRRICAGDDSFYEMINMSGREADCLSARLLRGKIDIEADKILSFISTDIKLEGELIENAFVVATETRLKAYYDDNGVIKNKPLLSLTGITNGVNKMIASGGYLYFFPDNVYINLMNVADKGRLSTKSELPVGVVDDTCFEIEITSVDETGKNPQADSGYVKLVSKKYRYYNDNKGDYLANHYFAYNFKAGDYVMVEGNTAVDGLHKIAYVSKNNDYIVISASITADIVQTDKKLTISRNLPEMDYVTAAGNRLWGCRYGVNSNGEPINEIYASSLGDAKNWYTFEGVSTDSYVASVGVDGAFTGAVTYEGDPIFFKEDSIIRVYGSSPSDFSIITSNVRGIEKGSSESAVIVDNTLYYKTYNGIVAYNGGLPYNVDEALGNEAYRNAVAGSRNGDYYVSMQNSKGEYELFVYNTANREWYREDNTKVLSFCRNGKELYMLTEGSGGKSLLSVGGTSDSEGEQVVVWSFKMKMDYKLPYRKILKRLEFKLSLEEYTMFNVEISYDDEDEWHRLCVISGKNGIVSVPVRPRRCNSFSLKFMGYGEFTLLSVIKTVISSGYNMGDNQ